MNKILCHSQDYHKQEKPGGFGGRVLSRTCVPKPKPVTDEKGAGQYFSHDFYTLDDFYIGETFLCFKPVVLFVRVIVTQKNIVL